MNSIFSDETDNGKFSSWMSGLQSPAFESRVELSSCIHGTHDFTIPLSEIARAVLSFIIINREKLPKFE